MADEDPISDAADHFQSLIAYRIVQKVTGETPSPSLVDAVFSAGAAWPADDQLVHRAEALGAFLSQERGKRLMDAYQRLLGLRLPLDAPAAPDRLAAPEEAALAEHVAALETTLRELRAAGNFWGMLRALEPLSETIGALLDLPQTGDAAGRISLLARARERIAYVADLSEIRQ
jgi:glycyl-tRNA synthetase beta subunit